MINEFMSWVFRFLLILLIAQFIFHIAMEMLMVFFKNYLDEKRPTELRKKRQIWN